MIDIEDDIKKIKDADFFSRMGLLDFKCDDLILVKTVEEAFVNPTDEYFKGVYKNIEWLPTSPTQADPFYKDKRSSKELVAARLLINKAILDSIKNIDKKVFAFDMYDFSQAARGGICFAFRQYILEKYFGLGIRWQKIVEIYYSGHWPIGHFKNRLVII